MAVWCLTCEKTFKNKKTLKKYQFKYKKCIKFNDIPS